MAGAKTNLAIIRTKLRRPPMVAKLVHRQRLFNLLDLRLPRPLTLVSAPAGYGKSVLVSSWLESSSRPSAWLSLDENDNDLRLFLIYFLASIRNTFSDVGSKTLALVDALTIPTVAVLAGNLANEIDLIEQPFILVLDDFHHINNESVLNLLTLLLRHPPQPMHLVLIGRRDPSLPISTLHGQSLVTEIRTQDLRFNEVETATYLTQVLETPVDASTVSALNEKTEGWVTGLHLAILSMRHRGNLDPRLLEPQVNAQYIMEYLFTEVFSRQPREFSRYLLGTSLPDRFCGPLCDAVCVPGGSLSIG